MLDGYRQPAMPVPSSSRRTRSEPRRAGPASRPARGLRRRTVVALAVVALVGAACGKDTSTPSASPVTSPTGSGTLLLGGNPRSPAADQTPPKGTNGLAFREGVLWIADLNGGQIVVVDPASGTILARYGPDQNVNAKPDDLAVAPDGSVWWTGFDIGKVASIGTDGRSTDIAAMRPGANAIAFSPAGKAYVTMAVTGDGLWELDPANPQSSREVTPTLGNVNAFAFGPDGQLYGPGFAEQVGRVVRIDTTTGATTEVAIGFAFPSALRFDTKGDAFVLSAIGGSVERVDLATGAVTPFAKVPTKRVDNMMWGPDGNLFVTAFDEPLITVISPTGDVVRTLTVGSR